MLVALETSTRTPSLAIDADGVVVERVLCPGAAHAADLLPALEALARESGAEGRPIRAVFVGLGPGSYTGLRVGIATALGLARGSGAHLLGVPSGEVIAFGELKEGESCVHLLDARQGQLYFARYARRADRILVLTAPCVLEHEELASRLPPDGRIFGDAGVAQAAGLDAQALARFETAAVPRAGALLELARVRLESSGDTDPASIEPLYLRPFAARARQR